MNIRLWNPHPSIQAGTTLRDQTQAEANNMALHVGGNLQSIVHNRKRLCETLSIPIDHLVVSQQTHSDHIHEVTIHDLGKGSTTHMGAIPDCDALYTKEKGIAIGVFHADCVPVLLYDPLTKIICAIHSGWQGSVQEITRKAMEHLIQKEGVNPCTVMAYIGPAINFESFECGMDVITRVQALSFDTTPYITYKSKEKAYVDNKGLNEAMLLHCGVLKKNITMDVSDTFLENEELFSYRRNPTCGRHLSFLLRTY